MAEPDLTTCPWCKRYLTRHMGAYYFGFTPTGIEAIDNILCSVASAGKAYHHTESWGESIDRTDGGESYVGRIQRAANAAADEMRRPTPPSAVDVLHEKAKLADEFAEILIQIRDEDGDLYGWQDENQGISVVGMELSDAKEWLAKWEALSAAGKAGGV